MSLPRLVEKLRRRVSNMAIRGTVRLVNFSLARTEVQVSGRINETKEGLEFFQPFGFSSHPVVADEDGKGAEAIILELDPDHRVVIVCGDRRFELKDGALLPGDSAQYSDLDDPGASAVDALHRIQLTRSNGKRLAVVRSEIVDMKCGSSSIFMDGEKIRLEADYIESHARKRMHWDLNGYGEDWASDGTAWWVDVWKKGNVVPGIDEDISPPEHDHGDL